MNIVWDFGAVLFRWRPAVLLANALPERMKDERNIAHARREIFRFADGEWAEFDRGTMDADELVRRVSQRIGWHPSEVQAVVDAVAPELEPIADNVACVEHLRGAGHRQFYLSNMPKPFADHLEREHAFVRAFDGGLFSGRAGLIKPEPALYALAEQRFGLDPAETLFFDDQPVNVAAARARGWSAVQVDEPADVGRALRERGLLADRLASA